MSEGHCTSKIYIKKIQLKGNSIYNIYYLKEIKTHNEDNQSHVFLGNYGKFHQLNSLGSFHGLSLQQNK